MTKKPAKAKAAGKSPVRKLLAPKAESASPRSDASLPALRAEYPREFDNGRRAARSGIPANQAPALDCDAKRAWLLGHEHG